MKALVTGAAGRLGGPIAAALLARGWALRGLRRRSPLPAGLPELEGDLTRPGPWTQQLAGVELVVHCAGGPQGAGQDSPEQLNAEATRGLIEALRSAGVRPLVLHLSSAAVYGDRSGLWLEEDMPLLPHTDYGRAKAAAEALLREAEGEGRLRLRVLRPGPIYGPGFPFLMVDRLRRGLGWLPGEGRNYLPVVHIADAVQAALAVLDRGRDGAIYNVADQSPPTSRDFYGRVAELLGAPPPRYWSTWVPSAVQHRVAGLVARGAARLGRRPLLTSDALRMATASARLKVDLLREELGFRWSYPRSHEGIAAALQDPPA